VLAVFHGLILRALVHAVAVKVAAGQNLKLNFQIEGDPFDQITLRNVHATPTGPTAVRSLEADTIKVDYSIPDLVFHGMSDALKNVELHGVTAVIDSSKALPTPTPAPNQKFSLPAYFPDRLEASNVNLTMKQHSQDMVVKDLNIGLYPDREGKLQIATLQVPGVDTWKDIEATTTYANKNLYLHNLTLDQNTHFETVNVDASQIGQGKFSLGLAGTLGGGKIKTQAEISTSGKGTNATTNLHAKDISLGKLAKYFGQSPGQLEGAVKSVDADLKGNLDKPSTLEGNFKAEMENVHAHGFTLDRVKVDAEAHNGRATIHEARIDQGNNHIQLRGSAELPKSNEEFGRTPGNLQFSVDAPDLQKLTGFMTPPASGSLQASGNIKTEKNTVQVNAHATGAQVHYQDAAIENLSVNLTADKKLAQPNDKEEAPAFEGLRSSSDLQMQNVHYGDFAVDQVRGTVKSDDAKVTLSPLIVQDQNNLLRASGSFQLPGPDEKLINQPADLQFSLRAPEMGEFWKSGALNKVTGQLQGDGDVRIRNGITSGALHFSGKNIARQELLVRQLNLQASIAGDALYLNDFTAELSDQDYIRAHGQAGLKKPFAYRGAATAHLGNLSTFEPLLRSGAPGEPGSAIPATAKKKTPLAGSLVVDWDGHGEAATFKNNGNLRFKLERGRYAELENLQANVEAHYTPQELNVPIVYLASDKLNLQTSVQAKNGRIEVSNLEIDQGKTKWATAYAAIPFYWSHLGTGKPLFPPSGNVQMNFDSENLDLAKLFESFGAEPPASGQLTVTLDAHGPLEQLQANLNLQLQNIEAAAVKQLEPTRVDVAMRLQNNELNVAGKIQQPKIQPVQMDARMPLNVSDMVANKKLDEQTPITAKVVMPRSSVNFIREFVPALRQLDGTLALNVNVDGTIANPVLSGAAEMNIVAARFENPTLPALHDFKAQLNFRNDTLTFERFGGDLAGGPFTISGRITLPKLTEPNFDLHLKANSVLVARNDNLTARVDADIKVEGPLKSATVSGQVLTTNSRFFKNIDIIPIALPGRPAPHPEPPSAAPTLSFPDPPLRDWKFDLTIKSKEPFLIRGNLATGKAIIDMKVAGTGLHPQLQGQVRLDSFDATLPFSTLSINLGFLYFDPDDPLNPRIELQGTSLIRDYTIHVYVYGTAQNPQAVFSSEPPLPQEEIISLLATGTTREELATGNVLASRAAILLVKQLYRKIFKKGAPPERDDSFFNRLDVDFGNVDPRTGEQTATARYKVSDHFVLIGDLGVQGGFRGLVKYLIRFR
jgi:hypothetical protein